jgi:carboxypeptidase Q
VHHTADDTLDKIDRQHLDQNVAAWAAVTWLIANSEVRFSSPGASSPKESTIHSLLGEGQRDK